MTPCVRGLAEQDFSRMHRPAALVHDGKLTAGMPRTDHGPVTSSQYSVKALTFLMYCSALDPAPL